VISGYLLVLYFSLAVREFTPYGTALQIQQTWLPVSIAVGAAFLGFGFYCLFKGISVPDWKTIYKTISIRGIVTSILAVLIVRLILTFVLSSAEKLSFLKLILGNGSSIFIRSITVPGIFAVSNAVYYGPIFIFTLLFWKEISWQVRELGYGIL